VLLSLNFPKRTTAASPEADPEPLRVLRERVEAPKTAGRLASAGVRFAFQSGGMASIGDYFSNAAKAVESGLSHDDAVRALTSWPADVLGVSSQLGSIEVGKIANLTITRGDLLAKDRRVAQVFIDGKPVDLRPATPSGDRGSNISGTWSLTVNLTGSGNEKQELTATLNLRQETDRLTWFASGSTWDQDRLRMEPISGSDVNFTVPITLPAPASQTTDANLHRHRFGESDERHCPSRRPRCGNFYRHARGKTDIAYWITSSLTDLNDSVAESKSKIPSPSSKSKFQVQSPICVI
jgi:hypothetical protein